METPSDILNEGLELDVTKAVVVIREHHDARIQFLQRSLKIDYARAVKVLGRLEELGLVGPSRGNKGRVIHLEALNRFDFSFALPSAPEAPRVLPPVVDGNASQDRPPAMPSADVSASSQGASVGTVVPPDTELGGVATKPSLSQAQTSSESPPLGSFYTVENEAPKQPTKEEMAELDAFIATAQEFKKALPEIRLCVVSYLPPPRFNTLAFLENLKRNPPAHELITFSDTPVFEGYAPPMVTMKRSIEIPSLMKKTHGVANLAFYLAFGECWKRGFTHFLYLESDVRCRNNEGTAPWDHWDDALFTQFFGSSEPPESNRLIVGGSIILNRPFDADEVTTQRAKELIAKWNPDGPTASGLNRFVPGYNKQGTPTGVGCNGAGAIYSVAGLQTLFPEIKHPNDAAILALAQDGAPFDFEIAFRLFQMHGADAFNFVAHLSAMFSSCGETRSTQADRLEMLRSGAAVLVHQIKSPIFV